MPDAETSSKPRDLQVSYYHPTNRFLRTREHIAVMDTNSRVTSGGDGELVAVFGPSAVGLFGMEQFDTSDTERSMRDARLFAGSEELFAASEEAAEAIYHALWERIESKGLPNDVRADCYPALQRLRNAIAAVKDKGPVPTPTR